MRLTPFQRRSVRLAEEALARLAEAPPERRFALGRQLHGYLAGESALAAQAFVDVAFAVSGGAGIVYAGERLALGSTSSSGGTISLSSNSTAGNLLLLLFIGATISQSALSVTDSKGNGWQTDVGKVDTGAGASVAIASANLVSALLTTDTITPTWTGAGTARFMAIEFSGIATSAWFDVSASNSDSAGTSTALDCGTTAATNKANEVVVGVAALAAARTLTAGGSFTIVESAGSTRGNAEYLIVASVGTQHPTMTLSSASKNVSATATYIGAAQTPRQPMTALQAVMRAASR